MREVNTWAVGVALLVTVLWGCAEDSERPQEALDDGPLALEFFAAGNMWMAFAPQEPLSVAEMHGLRTQLSAVGEATNKAKGDADGQPFYAILPAILFGARHLFEGGPFTDDDKQLAAALSEILVTDFGASELQIDSASDADVADGVQRIKRWFRKLCEDDDTLAAMIATLDDGPFYGDEIANESLDSWEALGDVELPNGAGVVSLRFLSAEQEPAYGGRLALQHKDASGDIQWTQHLTADDADSTVGLPAGLSDTPAAHYPGFGFVFGGFANWAFGTERMTVFLKDDATLRFYFLSW